jgi:hypothetical protein
MSTTAAFAFELRFQPLRDGGRAIAVPCDAEGRVNIDGLDHRQRLDYYFARSVIGRDFARPAVSPSERGLAASVTLH